MQDQDYTSAESTDQDSQWVTVSDLIKEPCPPVSWVVEGMLPVSGLSIIGARPKVGKSTVARSLAVAVALGRPWLGRNVAQGGVLYINMEEHRTRVAEHFQKFKIQDDDDNLMLRFGPPPENCIAWLREQVEKYRPVLVVIDPMIDILMRVKEITEYTSVARELAPFLKIVWEFGAHITFIHHNTKADADQGRELLGSTALFARVDSIIVLSKDSKNIRSFYSIQRYGDDIEPTALKLDASGWVTSGRTVNAIEFDELQTEIRDYLKLQTKPVDTTTIRNGVGHQAKQVSAALKSLLGAGKVTRSGTGKRGHAFKYKTI